MKRLHYKKGNLLLSALLVLFVFACKNKASDIPKFDIYNGPKSSTENVNLVYSDSGQVRSIMNAALQQTMFDDNESFPKGIDLVFYKGEGIKQSTIRSDSAYFNKTEDLWTLVGNVVVVNLEKNETLNTELLYWREKEERVWTEAKVQIINEDQILYGTGLDAKDDFSYYEIRNIEGVLSVD